MLYLCHLIFLSIPTQEEKENLRFEKAAFSSPGETPQLEAGGWGRMGVGWAGRPEENNRKKWHVTQFIFS